MDILPGLFSEDQVAERFGVGIRVVRETALKRHIGRKFARKRYFTEDEVLGLMKGSSTCLSSSGGRGRRFSTSEEPSTDNLSTRLQKQKTRAVLDSLRQRSKSSSRDQPGTVTLLLIRP